jgi:hypothetical protein
MTEFYKTNNSTKNTITENFVEIFQIIEFQKKFKKEKQEFSFAKAQNFLKSSTGSRFDEFKSYWFFLLFFTQDCSHLWLPNNSIAESAHFVELFSQHEFF